VKSALYDVTGGVLSDCWFPGDNLIEIGIIAVRVARPRAGFQALLTISTEEHE
jgi:hypothetical protein